MTSLQISMTEKQKIYSKDLLIKARASFENNGDRYSFASAIIRVLEEWSKSKGFIKNTAQGKKEVSALNLILNDPSEMEYVHGVIRAVESTPNPSNLRSLTEYIRRVDFDWKLPKDGGKVEIVRKAKELFRRDYFIRMSLEEAQRTIKSFEEDYDFLKDKRTGSEIREHAKKLR